MLRGLVTIRWIEDDSSVGRCDCRNVLVNCGCSAKPGSSSASGQWFVRELMVCTSMPGLCRGEEQMDSLLQSLQQTAESQLNKYKVSMGCWCARCLRQ